MNTNDEQDREKPPYKPLSPRQRVALERRLLRMRARKGLEKLAAEVGEEAVINEAREMSRERAGKAREEPERRDMEGAEWLLDLWRAEGRL